MTEGPIFHVEIAAATLADLKAFTDEIQPMILAAVPSCAAEAQSLSSMPTYRKHNSTLHAGRAQPAVYRSRSSRM